ncbi:unnamed protein product [Onchocerca flexuosa]|uniref:Mevalonate kinase n=1 Tax=Onchocerca flexuosa TaxID=387005 RepID=A0A183HFF8_9BILA|nr:unnamed protein product [Onchocerca flexuosa]
MSGIIERVMFQGKLRGEVLSFIWTEIVSIHDSPASSSRPLTANSSTHTSPMRSLSSASGGLYISAPGKIILFGEHAVVYGRTAVAGSIDLRTYVSLFTSADGRIYLSLPALGVEKTWLLKDLLRAGERLSGLFFISLFCGQKNKPE